MCSRVILILGLAAHAMSEPSSPREDPESEPEPPADTYLEDFAEMIETRYQNKKRRMAKSQTVDPITRDPDQEKLAQLEKTLHNHGNPYQWSIANTGHKLPLSSHELFLYESFNTWKRLKQKIEASTKTSDELETEKLSTPHWKAKIVLMSLKDDVPYDPISQLHFDIAIEKRRDPEPDLEDYLE